MPRPKNPKAGVVRATRTPVLLDRAECHVCRVLVRVDQDQVFVNHIADVSVRERGEYKLCAGTGESPTGPIIHGAEMVRRL